MIYKFTFPFELAPSREITLTAEVEFFPYEPATKTEPATASYYEVIGIFTPSGIPWSKAMYPKIWEHALDIASDYLPEQEEPEFEYQAESSKRQLEDLREFMYLFRHTFLSKR